MMQTTLVHFDRARRELALATDLDEVKAIRDKAEALRAYQKQIGAGLEMQNRCAEIKMRAERRAGELLEEQFPHGGDRRSSSHDANLKLEDVGISTDQSSRWRSIAHLPEPVFEREIAKARNDSYELTTAGMLRLAARRRASLHVSDDSYEWYTPSAYIEATRAVMGSIDLDPASTAEANRIVKAGRYYTLAEDGLEQPWSGNVWLNPPYNMPWIRDFTRRAIDEYEHGNINQAIVLVNNATDTKWFHALLNASTVICLTKGRIEFWSSSGEVSQTRQGQAFFYIGRHPSLFAELFAAFGGILKRWNDDSQHRKVS